MPVRSRLPVVAGVAAALVALPGAAQAATPTKTVDMGTPKNAQKSLMKYGADVNAFFPRTIAVHVGEKVRFNPVGFHTVDLAPRGGSALPAFTPTATISGANDAAGNPFWFNGQQNVGFNPALIAGLFGKSAKYDGSKRVDSGLPIAPKPKPFNVTFTKAGTYTYFCNVHPGMKGVVKVVGKAKKVPTIKDDKKAVAKQVAAALASAKKLTKTEPGPNTVFVGASDKKGVESFGFFPAKLSVAAGTTVKFQMSPDSLDVHTATTGPGDPNADANSYLGKLSGSLQSPAFDPAAIFPSDQPGGASASLTTTSHGNGFWNSGALDNDSATQQLPTSNSVTFSAPGTYEFYCLIHPFMHGTVTVQ